MTLYDLQDSFDQEARRQRLVATVRARPLTLSLSQGAAPYGLLVGLVLLGPVLTALCAVLAGATPA
jgi:hypothetical protein